MYKASEHGAGVRTRARSGQKALEGGKCKNDVEMSRTPRHARNTQASRGSSRCMMRQCECGCFEDAMLTNVFRVTNMMSSSRNHSHGRNNSVHM